MEQELEKLEGTVEAVLFANAEKTFTVFKLRTGAERSLVSVTAGTAPPLVGETLSLAGRWVQHAKFGEQFKAEYMTAKMPSGTEAIERFLSSGTVKGVGSAMAKRLVAAFGERTFDVIEHEPKRLREVDGIGAKKADAIREACRSQLELRELMIFLEANGLSSAYAPKIFARYGSFATEIVRANPYRLAREIDGIGFKTADLMAAALAVDRAGEARVAAGLDYVLDRIASSGHCCAPEPYLVGQAAQLLMLDSRDIADALRKLIENAYFCTEYVGGQTLVYPHALYEAETQSAAILLSLMEHAGGLDIPNAADEVAVWEKTAGIRLAGQQRSAVLSALEHGVFVMTGGPGTGKTTVVKGMIAVLEQHGLRILLGAPTGRAAKRLSEATGRKASTVHRLLEAGGGAGEGGAFARNGEEPLEADAIILDEVSMMDILLMRAFLEAVPEGCRVVLVGDADQLPAVGPGAVLKDILRSGIVPTVRLTEVYRQAEESAIVLSAHAINQGRMPDLAASPDFQFREMPNDGAAASAIVALCVDELAREGFDFLRDVQVLSPMHRMDCGVANLNLALQQALNPASPERAAIENGARIFRVGDKVMQTKNNYEKKVFNGDIGYVLDIDAETLKVRYPDLDAAYESGELGELQLAYAMTVHKSQGSEYPIVVMPLVAEHRVMLQRNLLYTAVTRAKSRVILFGSKAALHTAVANDRTKKRYTLLAERLRRELAP